MVTVAEDRPEPGPRGSSGKKLRGSKDPGGPCPIPPLSLPPFLIPVTSSWSPGSFLLQEQLGAMGEGDRRRGRRWGRAKTAGRREGRGGGTGRNGGASLLQVSQAAPRRVQLKPASGHQHLLRSLFCCPLPPSPGL